MKRSDSNSRDERARAFDALVRPHVRALYRSAMRFTGSRPDAEDLVQDVLVKLYRHRQQLSEVADPRTWMLRVLYREFLNYRRASLRWFARRRAVQASTEDGEHVAPAELGPSAELDRARLAQQLDGALHRLTQESRALVTLHLIEGYTLEELTDVFGVPIGTLKSRLHRARGDLKDYLGREPFDDIRCVDP
jgi:RNA polymerase sigma-70 factor (ECF subfamily)